MRKFKFKMISAFMEDIEISEICKDYDKQIEELWKKFRYGIQKYRKSSSTSYLRQYRINVSG
jgi:hypothetical protein